MQRNTCYVHGLVAECIQVPRKSRRKLCVDEKPHGLRRTYYRVIDMLRGILERRRDIVVLQIRIVSQNILATSAGGEQVQNVLHTHTQTANAWPTSENFRICCNTAKMAAHAMPDSVLAASIIAKSASQ